MIQAITDRPTDLIDAMKIKMQNGSIRSWYVDIDGDFSQTAIQWKTRAWFRAQKTSTGVRFNILGIKDESMDRETYAVYHGRFIEMLLLHFDKMFEEVTASGLATKSDFI